LGLDAIGRRRCGRPMRTPWHLGEERWRKDDSDQRSAGKGRRCGIFDCYETCRGLPKWVTDSTTWASCPRQRGPNGVGSKTLDSRLRGNDNQARPSLKRSSSPRKRGPILPCKHRSGPTGAPLVVISPLTRFIQAAFQPPQP
jgi:hypothetical protein